MSKTVTTTRQLKNTAVNDLKQISIYLIFIHVLLTVMLSFMGR